MKTYWKNFAVGSLALIVGMSVLGALLELVGFKGDLSGSLAELSVYVVAIGIPYSLVVRPWRKTNRPYRAIGQ